jgi:hypothetical protein
MLSATLHACALLSVYRDTSKPDSKPSGKLSKGRDGTIILYRFIFMLSTVDAKIQFDV